jgi:outer membrane protein assembly factor BamE (lipoprotein component of BamABCDE complex)
MRSGRSPGMNRRFRATPGAAALFAALLSGCVSYSGDSLKPGQSTLQDVEAAMGEPAMQWTDPDHSMQLSYPRGPAGFHSYMVYLDPAGHLQRIQNVMDLDSFYRISPGMTEQQVLRILGPSVPQWTNFFAARRELVWEWRYCNEFSQRARFDVLIDADSHKVRTSFGHAELCELDPCLCGR